MTNEEIKFYRECWLQQRYNTERRSKKADKPFQFLLTFDEWMKIWLESGKLSERGRTRGCYVMSRNNDSGNYEVGNVFIQKFEDNVTQAQLGVTKPERTEKHRRSISERMRNQIAWNKGVAASEDAKRNMSAAKVGKPNPSVSALKTCPHCGKVGGASAMTRYHFDNCKRKE